MFNIQEYDNKYQNQLIRFLEQCLPQSGRTLDLNGRHNMYCHVEDFFKYFWCLFDEDRLIGTAALRELGAERCELKALYLLEQYHKNGLGFRLLQTAISKARLDGYQEIVLDTLASSKAAISLYEKTGFVRTQRYNDNEKADIFMILKFDG